MVALSAFLALIQVIWTLLLIPTHLALTAIVYRDAKRLPQAALGISPFLWLGITFSLPIIGMFIYWIMNHSSLSRDSLININNLTNQTSEMRGTLCEMARKTNTGPVKSCTSAGFDRLHQALLLLGLPEAGQKERNGMSFGSRILGRPASCT